MPKVDYKDLEDVTKLLDQIVKDYESAAFILKNPARKNKAKQLSKMIKDKYTQIKPEYEL